MPRAATLLQPSCPLQPHSELLALCLGRLQVVLVLSVGAAVWAALQQRLRAVRECKACRGYGIQR